MACLGYTSTGSSPQISSFEVEQETMSKHTISQDLIDLCTSPSITSIVATGKSPSQAKEHLHKTKIHETAPPHTRRSLTPSDLEAARKCGRFHNPSDLFLSIYHEAILPLQHDPLAGVCSPSLLGSQGKVTLSIISTLPDICRHMSNEIARAHEVFLATNFWMDGEATWLITDALRELSRRAGARGERAVVKILYDRGNLKQFVENHQLVPEKVYTGPKIKLPSKAEIPNIDMEVMNYHRPLLGTFHSKFVVIDRKIGIIQSNNIQDNSNVEMMVQVEGPIVDSLYDTALVSWHNELNPPLPSLKGPGNLPQSADQSANVQAESKPASEPADSSTVSSDSTAASESTAATSESGTPPLHTGADPHFDPNIQAETHRMNSILASPSSINAHLNLPTKSKQQPSATEGGMRPYILHNSHASMALVNRKPYGAPNNNSIYTPQNEAWLAALRFAKSSVFIQTPDLNFPHEAIDACVKRGVAVIYIVCLGYNDTGELLPGQGGHNEAIASSLAQPGLTILYYVAKDQDKPVLKERNCHIKLMIVDEQVGIIGNGNQDTQSWCHSQEVNLMIDSADVCREWMSALQQNQNSFKYGHAPDGIWKRDGKEAEGAMGKDAGRFPWMKGVVGAVQRVRGVGGF